MKVLELEKTNRYIYGNGSKVQFENDINEFDKCVIAWFTMMENHGCENATVTSSDNDWYFQINYTVNPECI